MSFVAVALAVVLAVPPVAQQAPPTAATEDALQGQSATEVAVPDPLRQVLTLIEEPGFHPELLELFEIDVVQEAEAGDEPESGGLKPWHVGLIVGLAVLVGVLVWYAHGMANS